MKILFAAVLMFLAILLMPDKSDADDWGVSNPAVVCENGVCRPAPKATAPQPTLAPGCNCPGCNCTATATPQLRSVMVQRRAVFNGRMRSWFANRPRLFGRFRCR
jgi:hypothetical protein